MKNGITLGEFKPLKQSSKSDLLYVHSTWLYSFSSNGLAYNLFYLNDFYIEVISNNTIKTIVAITGFKGEKRLEKYLSEITLEKLGLGCV